MGSFDFFHFFFFLCLQLIVGKCRIIPLKWTKENEHGQYQKEDHQGIGEDPLLRFVHRFFRSPNRHRREKKESHSHPTPMKKSCKHRKNESVRNEQYPQL